MGKKKIQISKIQDEKVCQLTFYKRRKGVLKKAMELALLCGVDVFVTIIDIKQTFTFFTSTGTPKEFIDSNLSRLNRINIHKSYTIDDVYYIYYYISIINYSKRRKKEKRAHKLMMRMKKHLPLKIAILRAKVSQKRIKAKL